MDVSPQIAMLRRNYERAIEANNEMVVQYWGDIYFQEVDINRYRELRKLREYQQLHIQAERAERRALYSGELSSLHSL